jgi:hypothetical protein
MVSPGNQKMNAIFLQASGRRIPRDPAAELAELERARDHAEEAGDVGRVEVIDGRLDELVSETREHERERRAEIQQAFHGGGGGVRRPLRKRPTPGEQMATVLLQLSGRSR